MHRKSAFIFAALVLVSLFPFNLRASSGLVINEIMYDLSGSDAGHEWIELYNGGTSSVQLVGGSGQGSFRFNDGSNHLLAETALSGTLAIAAGGYAIIADDAAAFISDHPGYSGTVIDTSMSLPNTGGAAKIVDGAGNIIDSVSYAQSQGANGDGNSLGRDSDGSFVSMTPTPGAMNVAGSGHTTQGGGAADSSGGASAQPMKSTVAPEEAHMKAAITLPPSGIAGIAVPIKVEVFGVGGEYRQAGYFHIALGDGSEHITDRPESFTHTYAYPGSYVIALDYRSSRYIHDPEITARSVIEVAASGVIISALHPDGSIEIKNPDDSQADLSKWIILSLSNPSAPAYHFPDGTTILAGKTITLPPTVTGFSALDRTVLGIALPSGAVLAVYPEVSTGFSSSALPQEDRGSSAPLSNPSGIVSYEVVEPQIGDVLSAGALSSLASVSGSSSKGRSLVPFIAGLIGVIAAGIAALYRYRVFAPSQNGEHTVESVSETKAIADSVRILED